MDIKDIYSQSQAHKIISLDKSREMLSHAYMLECADEFLLDAYSLMIAKEIFCLGDYTPCHQCNNCMKVEHGNMVDLKIYPKDNKNIMVDDINEIVVDAYVRPLDSTKKVYILKNFDSATTQAQNKILKTLEEPPTGVIFILTCMNSSAVLQTICSRVKRMSESTLSIDLATKYLEEQGVKDSANIATIASGNISIASKLTGKGDASKIIDLAIDTLVGLRSSADVLKYSSQILALKKDFSLFIDTLIAIIRDVSVSGDISLINFKNKQREILALRTVYTPRALVEISSILNEIYNKLDFNCNITGIVDQLLLKILEVKFLCQK